jgi:uncharacterized membrane protein
MKKTLTYSALMLCSAVTVTYLECSASKQRLHKHVCCVEELALVECVLKRGSSTAFLIDINKIVYDFVD